MVPRFGSTRRAFRFATRGLSALFGKGTGTGLDFRSEGFDNEANFLRVPVKERILIVSIGGDVGQAADVVTKQLAEKKKEQLRNLGDEDQEAIQGTSHDSLDLLR